MGRRHVERCSEMLVYVKCCYCFTKWSKFVRSFVYLFFSRGNQGGHCRLCIYFFVFCRIYCSKITLAVVTWHGGRVIIVLVTVVAVAVVVVVVVVKQNQINSQLPLCKQVFYRRISGDLPWTEGGRGPSEFISSSGAPPLHWPKRGPDSSWVAVATAANDRNLISLNRGLLSQTAREDPRTDLRKRAKLSNWGERHTEYHLLLLLLLLKSIKCRH